MRNLTLADPDLNRDEKGAKDAKDWTPDENRCWFAWRVIEVRRAYNLTIDRREADALEAILTTCPESWGPSSNGTKTWCFRVVPEGN